MRLRSSAIAFLATAMFVQASVGFADPAPPDPAQPASPRIDLAPSAVIEQTANAPAEERPGHPVAAAITLGGVYLTFASWMYVAWYQHHKPLSQFKWGGDGTFFGSRTYAGGADRLGHVWSTMSLARGGAELLAQWGGYDRTKANLISTALAETLFIGVEVRDGFFFEFSFNDLIGDTSGALLGFALSQWSRLDELIDFRVEYIPSEMYLRKLEGTSPCPYGGCSRWNIAEDYSGQTYLLAFHLGGIHALRDMRYGGWSRFVDVTLGFDTRNYKPTPDPDLKGGPHQDIFIGVSLNAQGVFDWLLDRGAAHKIAHGTFEIFNLPYASAPVLDYRRYPDGPLQMDGAL